MDVTLFCTNVMSLKLVCTPVAPSNKTLGKVLSKKNCLLLKQFIVSDLQNVTWINQTRTLLPGRRAAPVPPRRPAAATAGHDPKPAVASVVPSPVPRECRHTPPGRQLLREQAHAGQSIFKQNAAPGRAALAARGGVSAAPAFCCNGGTEHPHLGRCSSTPTSEAVLPFWIDFGRSWAESLVWGWDNGG